jgi:YD repeat-containing protein
MRAWLGGVLALGGACVGEDPDKGPTLPDDDTADADADADADVDADADTDADTDTDTDTGAITDTATANCPIPWVPPGPGNADCTVRWTVDYGDDQSVDDAFVEVYSPTGKVLIRSDDWLADGVPDAVMVTVYDPVSDLPIQYDYDWDANGTVDSWQQLTYDAAGRLTEMVAYDSYGWTTRVSVTSGPCGPELQEVDFGDDGTVDAEQRITYSRTTLVAEVDSPIDGVIDTTITQEYDASLGRLVHREEEYDATHLGPEGLFDVSYDPVGGHRTRERFEYWNGSAFTQTDTTFALDADGREDDRLEVSPYGRTRSRGDWVCP